MVQSDLVTVLRWFGCNSRQRAPHSEGEPAKWLGFMTANRSFPMRASLLPLALAALALPVPALASPNTFQRYTYESYGTPPRAYTRRAAYVHQPVYGPRHAYAAQPFYAQRPQYAPSQLGVYGGYPVAAYPSSPAPPGRSCSLAAPIVGAALGGTMGGALAHGYRNRLWAVPMGAAVGGILGGTMSGC